MSTLLQGASFSRPFIQAFVKALAGRPGISQAALAMMSSSAGPPRVGVALALRWLETAIQLTGDQDLGLHAAEQIEVGDFDIVSYVTRSAATWGEAVENLLRYVRLMNDAADFALRLRSTRAFVVLHSRVPLNRAASDFQTAALLRVARVALGSLATFEVSFMHAEPADLTAYQRVFAGAKLAFGAVDDAFSFDRALLDAHMQSADAKLNAVLREHAENLLAEQPNPGAFTAKVRALLLTLLPIGEANSDLIATRLNVSRRTLARRLEQEGAVYKDLLEQARRELAVQYLSAETYSVEEIALKLGYSDKVAFSRAFRRWSGEPPSRFRRRRRD